MRLINDFNSRIDELIRTGYRVRIEEYIRTGFDVFRKAPELFLLYTLLYLAVMPFGGFIISGPLTAGFFIASSLIMNNKPLVFENFFDGFRLFVPLFLVMLIVGILVFFGFLLFIIPGIYLSVAYSFAIHFVIFEKLDFWEAMEASRKLVNREWFSIFGLIIVLGLLNFAGALAFGVGIILTIPISYAALYAAFEDIYLNR